MASRVLGFAILVFLVAAFQISAVSSMIQGSTGRSRQLLAKIDCAQACTSRCEVASVHDRCMNYCGICCQSCNCVPSGHYGNKDECSCYRDKKNSKGKAKCP
ncbi:hypothetical protein SELMODRAFT_440818 [Selaginella moellendorffii]|uniref:Uncharacterized protein n=1 Tax=Selaginella moellendorffii TaxID=88036 RepID=D8REL2_SELML|nr:peamaclein [Selaginella moellendorffii]EFJ29463.1 hypothetical protein SELMODRAFT_440818 [Selaginella moellendorffii]|eukprot:XP_002969375.1 peamaclein [Selaginella moellendorffii]